MSTQYFRNCAFQTILGHRQDPSGKFQFLIKWRKTAPSWQPLYNLSSLQQVIQQYLSNNQVVNYKTWGKIIQKEQNNNKITNKYENMELQDQNMIQSRKQPLNMFIKQHNKEIQFKDYELRYDEFFQHQIIDPKQRFRRKTTIKQSNRLQQQQNYNIIEWHDIKKAIKIQFNQPLRKYMVRMQFFDEKKQKIWVQKDILRVTNPAILLDLYQRIHRYKAQGRQFDQNNQIREPYQLEEMKHTRKRAYFKVERKHKTIQNLADKNQIIIDASQDNINVIQLE